MKTIKSGLWTYLFSGKSLIQDHLAYYGYFYSTKDMEIIKNKLVDISESRYLPVSNETKSLFQNLKIELEKIDIFEISKFRKSKIERGFKSNVILNIYYGNFFGFKDANLIFENLNNTGYQDFISVHDLGLNLALPAKNISSIGYSRFSVDESYLSYSEKEKLLEPLAELVFDINSKSMIDSFQSFKEYILSEEKETFYYRD